MIEKYEWGGAFRFGVEPPRSAPSSNNCGAGWRGRLSEGKNIGCQWEECTKNPSLLEDKGLMGSAVCPPGDIHHFDIYIASNFHPLRCILDGFFFFFFFLIAFFFLMRRTSNCKKISPRLSLHTLHCARVGSHVRVFAYSLFIQPPGRAVFSYLWPPQSPRLLCNN